MSAPEPANHCTSGACGECWRCKAKAEALEPADDVAVARVIADWPGPEDGSLPPYEGLRVDQAIPLVVHLARHGYTVVRTHPERTT